MDTLGLAVCLWNGILVILVDRCVVLAFDLFPKASFIQIVIPSLLQQYLFLGAMLLSFLDLLLYLFLGLAVVRGKFKSIGLWYDLYLSFGFGTYSVLNVEPFHLLSEFGKCLDLAKLEHLYHLCGKQLGLALVSLLIWLVYAAKSSSSQLSDGQAKLPKRHLLIAFCVLFEDLNEVAPAESLADAGDLEILAEDHKLIDSHDGSLVLNLFESGVLPSGIADFAIVLKDDLKVVLILFAELVDIQLIRGRYGVLIYLLVVLQLLLFGTHWLGVLFWLLCIDLHSGGHEFGWLEGNAVMCFLAVLALLEQLRLSP